MGISNFTTALVAALVLGSVGIASARVFAPSIEHFPHGEEPYCYLPIWPCEPPHSKAIRRIGLSQSAMSALARDPL
jgi:hypothetical protein